MPLGTFLARERQSVENGDVQRRGKNKNPVLLLALRVPFSDDIGYLREYWKDVPRGQRCQFSVKKLPRTSLNDQCYSRPMVRGNGTGRKSSVRIIHSASKERISETTFTFPGSAALLFSSQGSELRSYNSSSG